MIRSARKQRRRSRRSPRHSTCPGQKSRRRSMCIVPSAPISAFSSSHRCAQLFISQNYRACVLKYGEHCPPVTTIRGWSNKVLLGGVPSRPGRPTVMTAQEEESYVKTVRGIIDGGGTMDRETMQSLGLVCSVFFVLHAKTAAICHTGDHAKVSG